MSSKNLILAFFLMILILAAYKFSSLYYFNRYIYQPSQQSEREGMYITDRVTRVTNYCRPNDRRLYQYDKDRCKKIYDWR